MTWPEDTETE